MNGYLFYGTVSRPITYETVRFGKELFTCFDYCPQALYAQNKTAPNDTRIAAKGKQRPSDEQTIQRSRQTKYSLRISRNWGRKSGLPTKFKQPIKETDIVSFTYHICDSYSLRAVSGLLGRLCQQVVHRLLLVLSPFRCACTGTAA